MDKAVKKEMREKERRMRPTRRAIYDYIRTSGSAYGTTIGHVLRHLRDVEVRGKSPQNVAAHLKALREDGFLEVERIEKFAQGRPAWAYYAVYREW